MDHWTENKQESYNSTEGSMTDIRIEDISAHGLAFVKWHNSTRISDIIALDHAFLKSLVDNIIRLIQCNNTFDV
jgi:hypothetical protein